MTNNNQPYQRYHAGSRGIRIQSNIDFNVSLFKSMKVLKLILYFFYEKANSNPNGNNQLSNEQNRGKLLV